LGCLLTASVSEPDPAPGAHLHVTDFSPPLSVADLLRDVEIPWVFCGGWAIDLFLDRVTRPHKDVDVAIRRADQLAVHEYLTARGWRLQVANDGQLTPWATGERIELPRHGIWATHRSSQPELLEILLNEADDAEFRFRRDQSITCKLAEAFTRASNGLPILAPEIALLYKAAHPDEPDSYADFLAALPALGPERRSWLAHGLRKLHPGHTWLADLEPSR
jgi:hypothetical protein